MEISFLPPERILSYILKRERYILFAFGLLALATAIFGNTGFWSNLTSSDPHSKVKLEGYRIIERAQLWYGNSVANGGGDRSFKAMNFMKIGYSGSEDELLYFNNDVVFSLQNLRRYSFDLQITLPNGKIFSARNLAYNTHPEILIEAEE